MIFQSHENSKKFLRSQKNSEISKIFLRTQLFLNPNFSFIALLWQQTWRLKVIPSTANYLVRRARKLSPAFDGLYEVIIKYIFIYVNYASWADLSYSNKPVCCCKPIEMLIVLHDPNKALERAFAYLSGLCRQERASCVKSKFLTINLSKTIFWNWLVE